MTKPAPDVGETPRTDAAEICVQLGFTRTPTGTVQVDFARQLERELQAARESAQPAWQPIESAPRDGVEGRWGTPILLYCDPGIVSGRHYGGDSWVTQHDICEHVHSPTHWMPLPEPPAGGEG